MQNMAGPSQLDGVCVQHIGEMTVRETFDFAARCQGAGAKKGMVFNSQQDPSRNRLLLSTPPYS